MSSSDDAASDGGGSSLLTRSASYNFIPALNSDREDNAIRKTLSEVNLVHSTGQQPAFGNEDDFKTGKEILRQSSLRSKRKTGSTFTLGGENDHKLNIANGKPASISEKSDRSRKSRVVTGAFANFTRKSWKSSRSPSPAQTSRNRDGSDDRSTIDQRSATEKGPLKEDENRRPKELSRAASVLSRKSKRPLSAITPKEQSDPITLPRRPSVQSLSRKSSLEKLAASVGLSKKNVPPLPQNIPTNILKTRAEHSRKKDELWNVFRGLDADFQKYQAKSSSLKVNVIRSSLLPCLSRYAEHPSNKNLRPEDLDRRINILNKWWTGLLETLGGRTSHSITGVDRPVYLEAITAIMMRPEWRIPTTPNIPDMTPTQKPDFPRKSNTSLESTGSDFLIESIHHNIRNILSQNLLSQLSYCIDKMSTRHTPASLVTFAGKSCAYSFFFCRDVSDLLVRIWNLKPELLRRVIGQFRTEGSPTSRNTTSEQISSYFPPAVRQLSFTSHAALVRSLRCPAPVPLAASNINWFGPWVSRWCGRDTDLFFVFVKHFHILAAEFLPKEMDHSKHIYVPGLVSVHAQMLAVLENTLSKQSQVAENVAGAASTTFEDLFDGAEATATGFPLAATNSLRIMSENRLILILKNVLLDNLVPATTKQFFLETFCGIVKLAARKTSLFDNGPCFVLCDFVDELLPIIPPYCQSTGQPDIMDWDFWLKVCFQMMKSKNVVTEVRSFAFIFVAWDAITQVDQRKEQVCLEILLQEQVFYHYFSHWSPMIRSYFHRLICWRVARLNENPSALDKRIYATLSSRLADIWNYFISYQSKAEKQLTAPLSSVPCTPAPGRRIIIIRDDAVPPPTSLFIYLDNIPTADPSNSIQRNVVKSEEFKDPSTPVQPKKRWKVLKSIFGNSSNQKPGEVTPPGSISQERGRSTERKAKPNSASEPPQSSEQSTPELGDTQKSYKTYTFRFCLEWSDRQRIIPRSRRLFPPSLPAQTQIFLQSIRHAAISSSDSGSGSLSRSLSDSSSVLESDSDFAIEDALNPPPIVAAAASPTSNRSLASKEAQITPSFEYIGRSSSVASKYAGRALAEWGMVVSECDSFYQRRRDEGVPSDGLVEIPILGVESFRK